MPIDVEQIKKLREETGAGVIEAKQALDENSGDFEKAKSVLEKKIGSKAAKKQDRVTKDGLVYSYIHSGGKLGSLVAVACETDFVAKTDDFIQLCKNIAMQVCTDEYETNESLLNAEFIKDPSKKVKDIIDAVIAKTGEKVELKKFVKFNILSLD
jgi:elongation factor Ts